MSGEIGSPGNGGDKEIQETVMIRAIAEALANRFGLDLADGKLMDRPILCLLFMVENILDRVELLESVYEEVRKGK